MRAREGGGEEAPVPHRFCSITSLLPCALPPALASSVQAFLARDADVAAETGETPAFHRALQIHCRSREGAGALLARGAAWAGSAEEVGAACVLAFTCLPGDGPLEEAASRFCAGAKKAAGGGSGGTTTPAPKRVLACLGPASPAALAAVKATCAKGGVDLVAAHASGPPSAAARAGLLLHIAGPPGPRAAVAGILESACRDVVELGDDPGAVAALGAAALTARLGALEAAAEAMALAEAAGVPDARQHVARLVADLCAPAHPADGLNGAGLGAAAARMADPVCHAASSLEGGGAAAEDGCVAAAAVGGRHALALAAAKGVPAPALAAALHHLEQVDESGGEHLDESALATVHRDAAGLPT